MFDEDDLLPISALQHLLFCERQCALIHIEGLWAENRLTIEGRHLHEKAHGRDPGPRGGGTHQSRPGVRVTRGLALRSLRLGIAGKADVVEFLSGSGPPELPTPFPIEYKRGRPKKNGCDVVQLCAQAMCLEEMLARPVPGGAIFYGVTRHRLDVPFDDDLRQRTAEAITRLRDLLASGRTPRAEREAKCKRCSLYHVCVPHGTGPTRSVARFVAKAIFE
jgi:CRISPR-associated exonuclease Cas4